MGDRTKWWSVAEDKLLEELTQKKVSFSKIATSLPGRSRSAIAGRCKRLGLSVPRDGSPAIRKPRIYHRAEGVVRPQKRNNNPAPDLSRLLAADGPYDGPCLKFWDTQHGLHCMYVVGRDPDDDITLHCGKPADKKSFCSTHYDLCYTPSRPPSRWTRRRSGVGSTVDYSQRTQEKSHECT